MNGRQATQLILTLGAAQYADSGDTGSKTFYSSTRISVAGGQGNGTAYLLDGGDNTDAMSNVNMPFPFPDALQEFSVETSAVSSRFGTHPGATVNVVTKSGSNAFHGDLFEYIRNGDLNARNFFQLTRDTPEAQPVRRRPSADASSRTSCSSSAATRARATAPTRPRRPPTFPTPPC